MKDLLIYLANEKHQFKSYYCAGCQQRKGCGKLTDWNSEWKSYCCPCYYQSEQAKAEEYSNYQQVYQRKVWEREARNKQYQSLRNYPGCPQCGSLAVDACHLYNENELICQPCRTRKEGSSSSPISFWEQGKWFKKRWGINLTEWLENYGCLPINAECAREWLKDKEHLKNCQCLELEAQKHYSLVNDNLKICKEKLKECQCVKSKKIRISSDNYAWCEICEVSISVASKKRIIKNRNDPRFWGLEISEKVLCGDCLARFRVKMPKSKRKEFNRYFKRGMF